MLLMYIGSYLYLEISQRRDILQFQTCCHYFWVFLIKSINNVCYPELSSLYNDFNYNSIMVMIREYRDTLVIQSTVFSLYLPFSYSSVLIKYIVLIALIIGKTAAGIRRRTDPEEYMIYIGIDIAKQKFDFCIIDSELNKIRTGVIINNDTGFKEFLKIIGTYDNIRIGMESTNIYHFNLYNFLIENGYNPVLLNSIETKLMKRSRIRRNKTDKIDSEAIARYLIISKNNTISMVEYPELKQYVSTYFRLTRKLTAVKIQLIRDLDLLYPGMTSLVNVDIMYFNDIINNIINNIDNLANHNDSKVYIKRLDMKKWLLTHQAQRLKL